MSNFRDVHFLYILGFTILDGVPARVTTTDRCPTLSPNGACFAWPQCPLRRLCTLAGGRKQLGGVGGCFVY